MSRSPKSTDEELQFLQIRFVVILHLCEYDVKTHIDDAPCFLHYFSVIIPLWWKIFCVDPIAGSTKITKSDSHFYDMQTHIIVQNVYTKIYIQKLIYIKKYKIRSINFHVVHIT